jgi:hypothetical protein
MKALGAIVVALGLTGLAGCATAPQDPLPACPVGQEAHRTAQLFFGRNIGDKAGVTDADFRKFMDEEVTPKFPDGLTVMDGGGQWRGDENRLIREAAKIVLIILPAKRDSQSRIDAVRNAYKARFHQESVLVITQAACVSF